MNLLLLLSALLSALTGVAGGARAVPAAAQVMTAESRAALPAATREARLAARPVASLPTLAALAAILVVEADIRVAGPSLLLTTGRRRE